MKCNVIKTEVWIILRERYPYCWETTEILKLKIGKLKHKPEIKEFKLKSKAYIMEQKAAAKLKLKIEEAATKAAQRVKFEIWQGS